MAQKTLAIALAIAAVGTFSASAAWSQTTAVSSTKQSTATQPKLKLATQYGALAGSQRNADSLIAGLRDGKNILLITSPTGPNPTAPSVTFTPATGKLGYGNINIALSLAKLGIVNPTPAQLAAALNGGTITTASGNVTMTGVLAQRQSGMGWGQIAQARGVTLGSLVSESKTDKAGKKAVPVSSTEQTGSPGKSDQAHSGKQGNSGNKGGSGSGSGGSSASGSHGSSSGGGGGGKSK